MKLIKDTFLVRADKDLKKTLSIKGHDGKFLFLDTDFGKYEHATQVGEIASTPLEISPQYLYDNQLSEGDKIIFHHFVVQPDNSIRSDGEELFRCDYFHIWCKIKDEKIHPLEDFIFVEPILEPESSLWSENKLVQTKTKREFLQNQGIVFAASKSAKIKGVKVGDKVFFTNNADYDIKIIDKLLWRMRIRNIIGIEREGKIICLSDKLIAKEISLFPVEKESVLILMDEKKRERKGVVISLGNEINGINAGNEISYFYGVSGRLNYKGNNYAFINKENINYIIK